MTIQPLSPTIDAKFPQPPAKILDLGDVRVLTGQVSGFKTDDGGSGVYDTKAP